MDPNLSNMLHTLEASYKNYVQPLGQGATTELPLIQRVPFQLRSRNNFAKHYKPMVIAIGPIHHDLEYLLPDFKRGLAHLFINNFIKGETKTAYEAIKRDISKLRKRYEKEVTANYHDDELALMLFVDGCAVLAFIAKNVDDEFEKNFKMKNDFEAFAVRDLFLLENQLPFEVLESLMNTSNKASDLKEMIKKLIVHCMLHYEDPNYVGNNDLPAKPNHLLELLRSKFLSHKPANVTKTSLCGDCNPVDCVINLIMKNKRVKVTTFRNITELQAAGIKVKKSSTSYLTNISFEGERTLKARLKLPPMIVDDWTAPKFLNLIAYEMCPDFFNDFGISSYVCFMDSLIDEAEDVKELRDAGVLHNALGSDLEVATLFNEISNDLVPNFTTYNDVKKKIQKHYQNKWMTWTAEFVHDHFSSPWTLIASVAALIGLILTGIQTWDSMKPSNGSSPTG